MRATKIRVLLADDHVMVRDGLKRVIDEQDDMHVVAEAADGSEALHLAESRDPDVALVDISMPGWDGVTTAQRMAGTCPHVRIIAVTRHDDEGFLRRMLDAGVSGYVLKQSSSSDLVQAVRSVAEGRQFIDPAIRRSDAAPATVTADVTEGEPLTSIEEAVLRWVASAWSNRRIAEQLRVSPDDVVTIKSAGMRKTALLTRLQVLDYARSRGWIATAPDADDREQAPER